MIVPSLLEDPGRVDEPAGGPGLCGRPHPGRHSGPAGDRARNGKDLAAVVPLEHLEMLREILAEQEVERAAADIDWTRARKMSHPPQSWFDDEEDNPFEPEEGPSS